MRFFSRATAVTAACIIAISSVALADHQESDDKKDKMTTGGAPTMDLVMPEGLGFVNPLFGIGGPYNPWSIFDPFLLDMPSGGKGLPVYDANDATKIIGYMKMPARPKPTGPVHCMIKETGLLAKSVDDCEAAGGTVAK